jgi:hypothetical protein
MSSQFLRASFVAVFTSVAVVLRRWTMRVIQFFVTMRRRTKWWLATTAAVLALLYVFAAQITDFAVDSIYKNAAEPLDKELPVTVTSFRSAANVVSTIGGMGEGINCSMPPGIDMVFRRRAGAPETSVPVRQRFRQACVFHDLCYRHGLATYGYTQNDCDELLQEHALRICISVSLQPVLSECQLDAKKVAAGVKVGGFKAFQGWGRSTYYEFDPNPYRSIRFSAVRVIDHPFKAELPKLRDEPDQLLLKFGVLRGGVRLTCVNCADRPTSQDEFDNADAWEASRDVGLRKPELTGFIKSRKMNSERSVWLPASRLYSAPRVVPNGPGRQLLVWAIRQSIDNSESCIIAADPRRLLTDLRPFDDGCVNAFNHRMDFTQVDLLSSAPQVSIVPDPGSDQALPSVVATGLTAQRPSQNLELCVSRNVRRLAANDPKEQRRCHLLRDTEGQPVSGVMRFEAFQNFPIVRGNRHIYLSRTMTSAATGESVDVGRVIELEIENRHLPNNEPPQTAITFTHRQFEISDIYDPMLPITFDPDDLKMIGVRVSRTRLAYWLGLPEGTVEFFQTDLGAAPPEPMFKPSKNLKAIKPAKMPIKSKSGSLLELHASWARRPIHVVESASSGSGRNVQLILSRSAATPITQEAPREPKGKDAKTSSDSDLSDHVQFEFAILERSEPPSGAVTEFRLVRGLACTVDYTVKRQDTDRVVPCRRTVRMVGNERATPATMLQGAQLLSGRFAKGDSTSLAIMDTCLASSPIVIQPPGIGEKQSPDVPPASNSNLLREMNCRPIDTPESLARAM